MGAVIVAQEKVIGRGYHHKAGEPHAEVEAIRDAQKNHPKLLRGSTIYVTLEPCCTQGKTPPCTEALIAVEEARAWERIRAYKQRLTGKKVLLITGGVKSWSVVSALQEAGLEVVGTSTKKSTKEDKEKIKEIMGDDAHMIDDMTPREMYAMLSEARADIMLSGGRSQFVALKARMPWMDINQERHHAFAGYEGMVTMIAEIDKALFKDRKSVV